MNSAELIRKIKDLLKDLTKKKNILFVKRGNTAIEEVIKLSKALGKEKILIQDQGGWITYKQFANKYGLMCIEVKTDYGLTDLEDLEKKTDGKSVFIVNSMPGYYADEDMHKVAKVCEKKHCLLVNDVSGSIGLKLAKYGDIILGSFNRWKPINMLKGGFLAFDDQVMTHYQMIPETQTFVKRFFSLIHYFRKSETENSEDSAKSDQQNSQIFEGFQEFQFKDDELETLYSKIQDIGKRQKFFSKHHWKIKKDLKHFDMIHPKRKGINVIVKYKDDEEKNKIIKYCEQENLEYTECPRYIRVNEKAISIEVKRL